MTNLFRKQSASTQLAEELKVSIQQGKWLAGAQLPTVRQLAEDYRVSLNTVHAAMKQLEADDLIECRPRQGGFVKAVSQWAGHVSAGAPHQIAVIRPISEGEDPSVDLTQQTGRIVHGIERTLSEHDLHPVLLSFGLFDPDATEKILRQVDRLRSQIAGVIVFAVGALRHELFDALDERELTWVTVNRLDHHTLENFVHVDSTQCGESIGICLAEANVSRAIVMGTSTQSNVERVGGLLKGYWERSDRKLSMEFIHLQDWQGEAAFESMIEYLDVASATLPEAVVGLGDIIAVGCMRALQSRQIRVPEDVKVISTTNLAIAEYSSPPLTAFRSPIEELGQQAASILMGMLASGRRRVTGRFIAGEIIFRESFPDVNSQKPAVKQVRNSIPQLA
ncbi:MAG: LacI family DNA-binding transcriptional regulator [Phycisphaerales bacterium]|jgi:DNA-binding LacI/PurR family transcriptional regulator|nr:LacI family DNA-binding transcriptional regulator [Phycisphaerales bacterium]